MDKNIRFLRVLSLAVTLFASLILLAGLVQIGLGGVAVGQEYDRIAEAEEKARQLTEEYGYRYRPDELQLEYSRTSTAFFVEGRFLPSDETLKPDAPAIISLIVLLTSGLAFIVTALMWVWRAHANLREAGTPTKQSPAMATAAYLIPIANLVLPFDAMRELHNRSHGETGDLAHSTVDEVNAWWAAVIIGLLILSAIIVKFALDIATNIIVMTPLWMEFGVLSFALLLLLGSASMFAGLARKISAAQQEYLPQIDPDLISQESKARPVATAVQNPRR